MFVDHKLVFLVGYVNLVAHHVIIIE